MQNPIRHHAIAGAVAAAISLAGAGYAVRHKEPPVVVQASTSKIHKDQWYGLSDEQAAALVAKLKAMPVHSVSIFCRGPNCTDFATDLEDAFDEAGWPVGIEHPNIDTNVGLNVGPDTEEGRALAQALHEAIGVEVGVLKAALELDRLAVVISKKP